MDALTAFFLTGTGFLGGIRIAGVDEQREIQKTAKDARDLQKDLVERDGFLSAWDDGAKQVNCRMPSRFGFQFGRTNRQFENIVRLTIADHRERVLHDGVD